MLVPLLVNTKLMPPSGRPKGITDLVALKWRDSSLISTISYSSAGSIAVENTNDAGEVACNKPEAPAKGIERYAFENALRWRFRLVSPVPAQSALASAPGLPHGQPQPPKHPSPSSDTTNLGGVRRGLSKWKGRIGIAKPLFGTTATHAACLFAAWGDDKAAAFFKGLKANDARFLSGNKQVAQAVGSGQLAFGLTDTDDAVGEIDAGSPVEIVYPDRENGVLLGDGSVRFIKSSIDGMVWRALGTIAGGEVVSGDSL